MQPVETPVAPRRQHNGVPAGLDHEQLAVVRGERSGATMAIAVHSTKLGPSLGGVRLWHYDSDDAAVADALRLAGAMTLKAAAAGLGLGGGKGVVRLPAPEPPTGAAREQLLFDFGDLVESLGGRYVTAEDVGTGAGDMVAIATRTTHVTGLPPELGGSGDPSPFTAIGVQAAMRAACSHALGSRGLGGRTVAIVGVGHVGEHLARGLAAVGAELILADVHPSKRTLAGELGARWLNPEDALVAECDVLAPCAVGGAITAATAAELRCQVVCGAANNQLADERLAGRLAERGIVYAPDFIANAGGLINVYRELRAYDEERARTLALGIEQTMARVLETANERGITPLEAASEVARERLDGARR